LETGIDPGKLEIIEGGPLTCKHKTSYVVDSCTEVSMKSMTKGDLALLAMLDQV